VTGVERDPHDEVVITSRGPSEPSKDSAVHAAVYAGRPEATTIFHFHVGSLDVLTDRLGVPTTSTYYPAGTKESMEEIEGFLRDHDDVSYFVLVDHGIVALGSSVDDTGALVETHQAAAERET
jgi:ribulose-5-phosphate 4-epimerase/fuculose-1-phosphate aldolase